jgi:hypothetical protein
MESTMTTQTVTNAGCFKLTKLYPHTENWLVTLTVEQGTVDSLFYELDDYS